MFTEKLIDFIGECGKLFFLNSEGGMHQLFPEKAEEVRGTILEIWKTLGENEKVFLIAQQRINFDMDLYHRLMEERS